MQGIDKQLTQGFSEIITRVQIDTVGTIISGLITSERPVTVENILEQFTEWHHTWTPTQKALAVVIVSQQLNEVLFNLQNIGS